jgi:UDP-glucose 4-epimerase
MNWLITGGCGFIGRNLIKNIINFDKDYSIKIFDNLSVGKVQDVEEYCGLKVEINSNWKKNSVTLVVGDIIDENALNSIAENSDVIVHLAANTGVEPSVKFPRIDCLTNVIGTLNALEAARNAKAKRFIFASSGAPAGITEPPIHEEIVPHPISPYGASKLSGEGYCSAYYHSYQLETVALRFGNVYGPGSTHKSSVVAKFIRLALNNEPLEIYGDGKQTRDFIYVEDLCDAIILASTSKNPIGGEVFQIATSREMTVSDITDIIVSQLNLKNIFPKVIYGERRNGDMLRNYSDTSKAKKYLNWESKTSLIEGINKTIRYFTE